MKAQWLVSILLRQFLLVFSPSDYQRMRLFDGQNHLIIFSLTNVSGHFLFFRGNSPDCTIHASIKEIKATLM